MIERNVSVGFSSNNTTKVRVSQFDAMWTFVFAVYMDGERWTIPNGLTVQMNGRKPDKNVFAFSGTIVNNTVKVDCDIQMTACAGLTTCELVFLDGNGKTVGTANFILAVEAAPKSPDDVSSETTLPAYAAVLNAVSEDDESVRLAAASAASAAADADRAEEAARSVTIDSTLTETGEAADAKKTGDALAPVFSVSTAYSAGDHVLYNGVLYCFDADHAAGAWTGSDATAVTIGGELSDLKADLNHVGLTQSVKVALLACFEHCAWIDDDGQDYYDALETALYESDYPMITATFNPGSAVIYTDDTLNSLKQYITVTYYSAYGATGVTVAAADYTLSGTLTEGQNVIRVSYNDLSTTFVVTAIDYYNIHEWSMSNGLLSLWRNGGGGSKRVDNILYLALTNTNTRYCLYASRGRDPYHNYDNMSQVYSNMFPIPIPDDATTMTVSITPATQYWGGSILATNGDGSVSYLSSVGSGWTQGTATVQLPEGIDRLYAVNTKYDSAGTSYPTNPTNFVVTFGTT